MTTKRQGVAVVTGGASGIGAATARRLLVRGLTVVLADIQPPVAPPGADDIGADRLHALACNVTDESAVAEMMASAEELGPLQVLVNCAGRSGESIRLGDVDIEQWRSVVDTNLLGTALTCRAASRIMADQREGAIVNVASVAGLQGSRGQVAYSAAKAGVIGLTVSLAKELLQFGVRVNAVAPGFVATPMTEVMPENIKQAWRLDRLVLGGGLGQPDQIATCIDFLASDEASFVTGVTLPVDGGFRLGYP